MLKKSLSKSALMIALMTGNVIWGGTAVHAEEPQHFLLDEYVVTATRNPVKEFDANANISVVTSKDIERQHYETLEEALRDVSGVNILDYGRAGYNLSAGLRINGSPNIVVLVDGVRVTQANVSSFPASGFTAMENVERIEVLKGSATTLYGADAKGGVINIITKKPQENKTKLTIAGGNFGKENYALHNEGKDGKWGYSIDAKKRIESDFEDGNGNKVPQHLNANTIGMTISGELSENTDLKISYNDYKSDFMYYDEFYDGKKTKGIYNNKDYGVTLDHRFDKNTNNRLSIKKLEYKQDYSSQKTANYYVGNYRYFNNVKTLAISDQFTKIFGKNTLVTGIDYSKDNVDYVYSGSPQLGEDVSSKGFYLRNEYAFDDKATFAAGVRYDKHSIAGSEWTPNFNFSYKFTENTNSYISYSKFFVTPAVSQYFGNYGNPNLKPETGDTIEFGINHKFDDTFAITAHVFKTQSDNKIDYDSAMGSYYNVFEQNIKGYDIQFNKIINNNLSLYVGYTYSDVKQIDAQGKTKYNEGGYLPKHAVNLGVNYTDAKWDVGLMGRAAIDRGQTAIDGKFPSNNYWIFDLGINYHATKNIKPFLKINNLFNKFYAEHSAVSATGDERWYTMPGRSILAGMEYTF